MISLCRVEELKQMSTDRKPQQQTKPVPKPRGVGPLTAFRDADSNSLKPVHTDVAKPVARKGAKFTEEELQVLM